MKWHSIRMQPEMEPESDAPPLRRGTQLRARPLAPNADLRATVRAPGDETPRPGPITPPTKDLGLETPCEGCGHDADRHRRGRCWTDWQGEPVHRARTQIDCNCQEAL
jgi:hypothetical protein